MSRERKIHTISLIILIGFSISVFYHYIAGVYGQLGYPYNTFLFRPDDRFMDFIGRYKDMANHQFNPYSSITIAAIPFPFLYRIVTFFTIFDQRTATLILLVLFSIFFWTINQKEIKTTNTIASLQNTFIFSFLSYPFLISFDRANLEIVVFFLVYAFVRSYNKNDLISAIFLGLAIALKALPIFLAILLLSDKRYKAFIVAGITAFIITLIGYLSFPSGLLFNISGHLRGLTFYNSAYGDGTEGLYFGNSLFGAVKFLALPQQPSSPPGNYIFPESLLRIYMVFALIGIGLLVAYLVFIETRFWRKVALATCAMNLFPLVSGDYKLLHVFIPLFLFINKPERSRLDWLYTLLFSLLLIPTDYYRLSAFPEASSSVLIYPSIMSGMVLAIIIPGSIEFFRIKRIGIAAFPQGSTELP